MMKRLTGMIALVMLAGFARAQETFRAEIKDIDLKSMQLKIEVRTGPRRGQTVSVTLSKDTKVEFGARREPGALVDLEIGRRARFTLSRDKEGLIAIHIRVTGRRPMKTEKVPELKPIGPGGKVLRGLLQRVAYTDREIVLFAQGKDGKQSEVIVGVPKDVKVIVKGKTIPYEELKDGQQAAVRVATEKGKPMAEMIYIGEGDVPAMPAQDNGMERIRRIIKVTKTALDILDRLLEK